MALNILSRQFLWPLFGPSSRYRSASQQAIPTLTVKIGKESIVNIGSDAEACLDIVFYLYDRALCTPGT